MKSVLLSFGHEIGKQKFLLLAWMALLVEDTLHGTSYFGPSRNEIGDPGFLLPLALGIVWSILTLRLVGWSVMYGPWPPPAENQELPPSHPAGKILFFILLIFAPSVIPRTPDLILLNPPRDALANAYLGCLVLQTTVFFWFVGVGILLRRIRPTWPVIRLIRVSLSEKRITNAFLFFAAAISGWLIAGYLPNNGDVNVTSVIQAVCACLFLSAGSCVALVAMGKPSFGKAVAGFGAALVIGILGYRITQPVSFLFPPPVKDLTEPRPPKVEFALSGSAFWKPNPGLGYPQICATLSPVQSGSNASPAIYHIVARFQPGNSMEITLPEMKYSTNGNNTMLAEIRKLKPELQLPGRSIDTWNDLPSGLLPLFGWKDAALQAQGQTGILNLKIEGRMLALQWTAEIPLHGPRSMRTPGGVIQISTRDISEGIDTGLPVSVLDVSLLSYRKAVDRPDGWGVWSNTLFILADSKTHKGVVMNNEEPRGGDDFSEWESEYGGWEKTRLFADVEPNLELAGIPLDQMVLYVFHFEAGKTFESTLAIPNFLMQPEGK